MEINFQFLTISSRILKKLAIFEIRWLLEDSVNSKLEDYIMIPGVSNVYRKNRYLASDSTPVGSYIFHEFHFYKHVDPWV